jgi:rubrerythrin
VFVPFRDGIESLPVEHARSGHEFGEAELVWRRTECGEMGEADAGLPAECPDCGEPEEAPTYWTGD